MCTDNAVSINSSCYRVGLAPFRTAVPFWRPFTQNLTVFSPKRDPYPKKGQVVTGIEMSMQQQYTDNVHLWLKGLLRGIWRLSQGADCLLVDVGSRS